MRRCILSSWTQAPQCHHRGASFQVRHCSDLHSFVQVRVQSITIQWVGVSARGQVSFMSLRRMNWNFPRSPVSNPGQVHLAVTLRGVRVAGREQLLQPRGCEGLVSPSDALPGG
jgi:hypothetical protein